MNPVKVVIDSIIAPAEIANENSPTPSNPLLDNVILLIKKKNIDAVMVAKTDFLDKVKRLRKYGFGFKDNKLFNFFVSNERIVFLLFLSKIKYTKIQTKKYVAEYKYKIRLISFLSIPAIATIRGRILRIRI